MSTVSGRQAECVTTPSFNSSSRPPLPSGTTLLTAFPQAWRWRALRFNDVLFALRQPVSRAEIELRAQAAKGRVRLLLPLFRSRLSAVRPTGEPLTDDRAPVEWLTDRMILDQIERGGSTSEPTLPTAPR